jgi:mevalonate kinase
VSGDRDGMVPVDSSADGGARVAGGASGRGPVDRAGSGGGAGHGDSRELPPVAVSAPGKLILMGEHAVVYGRPALVAAIDLRLRARFGSPPPAASPAAAAPPAGVAAQIDIDLPGLPHHTTASWREVLAYARAARDAWTAYEARPRVEDFLALRGDDPAHLVKVALGEVAAALGEEPESAPRLCLRLDSDLPLGSGFGSSAAAAVAVVAGFAAWRQGGSRRTAAGQLDSAAIEGLALEAERRQHGLPSGVDTATSLHGGVLWARRLQSGVLACERLAAVSPLLSQLRVYHTGTPPESTGAVVAAVRAQRDRDPAGQEKLFDRMEAATLALRRELDAMTPDAARTVTLIREHQTCLEALGVVPAPVRALVRRVEAAGGAAKVSGAGSLAGPGAGSLLVYHQNADRIADWDFLRPFPSYPVHLGAAGCRREVP